MALHRPLRRGTPGKRLAQRGSRLRIPQPGRVALSPQDLRRVAAATPDRGQTWRRNQTRLRDEA
jgi:predicted metal-dependent enzyme (double-stranded beta helix superfamily)